MIYRFILLPILIIIVSQGMAQLKGGIKGGINVSDIIVTNKGNFFEDRSFETRTSFHIGSFVKDDFSRHFGWQIEMLFSNKGYVLKTPEGTENISLNYLNWPIMLVYGIGKKLDLNTGIELGFMVTGDDLYSNFDAGIDVGIEYDITEKLILGFRYNHGLPFEMNLDENGIGDQSPSYQHSVIQFFLGFNILPAFDDQEEN